MKRIIEAIQGNHLTDEQIVEYDMHMLSLNEKVSVMWHTLWCNHCRTRLKHLQTVSKAWKGKEGERRLDELRKNMPRIEENDK